MEQEERPQEIGGENVELCDICGQVMLEFHCKLVCRNCGYTRDCSDP